MTAAATTALQEHDVVRSRVAVPAAGDGWAVVAGQVGTIVHIATAPDLAYLVEFADDEGVTLAMPWLKPTEIERQPADEMPPRTAAAAES